MQLQTTRFGAVEVRETDILTFPLGLIGLEAWKSWVVLADAHQKGLGWLQSVERPDLALAVVSPRRFVADYRARVSARDLAPLELPSPQAAHVVVTVSCHDQAPQGSGLSLNLKAPIVVCLETRRGRQVVAKDDHAVRHWVGGSSPMRRSA
jgi:flagellar assembly factor FliW